jgi:RecJ-like exonuclease
MIVDVPYEPIDFVDCPICKGSGKAPAEHPYGYCVACYGTGLAAPDEVEEIYEKYKDFYND